MEGLCGNCLAEGGPINLSVREVMGCRINLEAALISAAKYGHEQCIDVLLAAETDVNKRDERGCTALVIAADSGHEKCMKQCLKAVARVNVTGCLKSLSTIITVYESTWASTTSTHQKDEWKWKLL